MESSCGDKTTTNDTFGDMRTLPRRKLFLRLSSSNTDVFIEKASMKVF